MVKDPHSIKRWKYNSAAFCCRSFCSIHNHHAGKIENVLLYKNLLLVSVVNWMYM